MHVNAHKEREGALKLKREREGVREGCGGGRSVSPAMNTKYSAAPPPSKSAGLPACFVDCLG